MRLLALFVLLLFVTCVHCKRDRAHKNEDPHSHHNHEHHTHGGESKVLVFTEEEFKDEIKDHSLVLVKFYAPWCKHCKRLEPEFEKAAHELDGEVVLAEVDCTVEKDLCSEYNIRGFPTLNIFRNDGTEPSEVNARHADEIVEQMRKFSQPAYWEFSSAAELDNLKQKDPDAIFVVGHFADGESEQADAFQNVATKLRGQFIFVVASASDIGAGTTSERDIVMLKNFDDPRVVYNGDGSEESIIQFITDYGSFPLVGDIGHENYLRYIERDLPLVWCFLDLENEEAVQATLPILESVAANFRDAVSFVKLDGVRWTDHAATFGLADKLPGIVIEDRHSTSNFIYTESQVNERTLNDFVQAFLNEDLSPSIKSEPIPESNDGAVTVVVGNSFKDIVMDNDKDVFLEVYVPWCGHCIALQPKWEAAAAEFANRDSVVIAKMHGIANDYPFDVEGFPYLIFFPAGDKSNPVEYKGGRTVDELVKFVWKHGKTLPEEERLANLGEHEHVPRHDEL